MKKPLIFALVTITITLLTVSAYAQNETPTKTQSKPDEPIMTRTEEGPKGENAVDPTREQSSSTIGLNAELLDAQKEGDQTMNYGAGDGNNHELGDNNRHGEDYTGVTGPHGPVGTDSDLDKNFFQLMGLGNMFGEDSDGSFAGALIQHSWGPGMSGEGGLFGPCESGGFGPAGSDINPDGSSVTESKKESRTGRR